MESIAYPTGPGGHNYAVWHDEGGYISMGMSGRYHFQSRALQDPERHLTDLLKHALKRTILRHRALSYGVYLATTVAAEAQFVHIPKIQWEDVVDFESSDRDTADEDAVLGDVIGKGHEHLFRDQHSKPAWKVTVVSHQSSSRDWKVDVVFHGHHSLFDGTSGAHFHTTLDQYLNEASSEAVLETNWPVSTTPEPPFIAGRGLPFKPWVPFPASKAPDEQYSSRALILTIPQVQVQEVLQYCRRMHTTITGYLHGLLVSFFARTLREDQARVLMACTPISIRHVTGLPNDELACHISSIHSTWDLQLVSALRLATEDSPEEQDLVLKIAQEYHENLRKKQNQIATGGTAVLVDMLGPWVRVPGQVWPHTMHELSNIGVINAGARHANSSLSLEKLIFSQCGMSNGPGQIGRMGVNVATLAAGPMAICLTWAHHLSDAAYGQQLRGYLAARLARTPAKP